MSRRDKLRYEAKQRRILGKSKLSISMEAFKPESMYDSPQEEYDAWEESGVMNNIRNTLNFENDDGDW